MAYKSKPQTRSPHKSRSPQKHPTTSRSNSKSPTQKSEIVETFPSSPEIFRQSSTSELTPESPEVYSLIKKLEGISISAKNLVNPEASEESVTSLFKETGILTRSKSQKLGIPPFEFPIESYQKKVFISRSKSDTSEVTDRKSVV